MVRLALAVLTIVATLANRANAAYTMNETCLWYKEGHIGDPNDCQGWGYCSGGKLIQTGKCGTGLNYDTTTATCNYADQVVCSTTAEEVCANLANPQFISDPNNCNRYCYCANGTPDCANCPQYQVFDQTKIECVWASQSSGCSADSICRLIKNNDFIGDPEVCGNYYRCVAGSGSSAPCPEGTLYNPTAGGCDPNYKCSGSGGTSGDFPLPTDPLKCTGSAGTEAAPEYIPDDKTCMGYYICTSDSGPGTWGQCPLGTHFDGTECVTPYDFECTQDRCNNLNLQFVAEQGCKTYTYCENMKKNTPKLSCPTDYPYFDEFRQGCVKGKPLQKICGL